MGKKNGFEKEVSSKKFKIIILWMLVISLCITIYNYGKTNTNFLGPKKEEKKSSLGMGCLVFIIGRDGYSLKGEEYECLGDSNS